MNEHEHQRSEQKEAQPTRHLDGRVVGPANLKQHQVDTSDDQTKQTGGVQRDVDLLERVNGFQASVVERVVLLSDGFLLRAHEFVNGLAGLDGEGHAVEKIRPQRARALVSDDSSGLWERCVPLVDQGFDALDLRSQLPVVPHLLEDVKDGLGTHFTDG